MEQNSRERYNAHSIPFSSYARKQAMLKGKKILFNGVPLTQYQKLIMLIDKGEQEIELIANGRDRNYTTEDKPGWVSGELMNVFEYERYLSGLLIQSRYN